MTLINDNLKTREFVASENEYQVDGLYETITWELDGQAEMQSDGMRFTIISHRKYYLNICKLDYI